MRLFESIVAANARTVAGQPQAGDALAASPADLPVAVLTCIDARLNQLLPEALGLPEAQLIWLRNAGNIITGPLSSTLRSLALACAIKGAKEIAIIGHTDCLAGHTTALELLDRLAKLGVDRHRLPQNLVEYFGLFATERQNVLRGVELVRVSPLIGPRIPVHGLLIDIRTGRLEWVVNGYQVLETAPAGKAGELFQKTEHSLDAFAQIGNAVADEWKLPSAKIGELAQSVQDWLKKAEQIAATVESTVGAKSATGAGAAPTPAQAPPTAAPPPLRKK